VKIFFAAPNAEAISVKYGDTFPIEEAIVIRKETREK
jgi:hypothetical protein